MFLVIFIVVNGLKLSMKEIVKDLKWVLKNDRTTKIATDFDHEKPRMTIA